MNSVARTCAPSPVHSQIEALEDAYRACLKQHPDDFDEGQSFFLLAGIENVNKLQVRQGGCGLSWRRWRGRRGRKDSGGPKMPEKAAGAQPPH